MRSALLLTTLVASALAGNTQLCVFVFLCCDVKNPHLGGRRSRDSAGVAGQIQCLGAVA